ncbi:MAG: hypothetical protein LBH49_00345 [Puniceicoccales bacterium]|nr:hypothetical protein [Puniceicoccales bacterium]
MKNRKNMANAYLSAKKQTTARNAATILILAYRECMKISDYNNNDRIHWPFLELHHYYNRIDNDCIIDEVAEEIDEVGFLPDPFYSQEHSYQNPKKPQVRKKSSPKKTSFLKLDSRRKPSTNKTRAKKLIPTSSKINK